MAHAVVQLAPLLFLDFTIPRLPRKTRPSELLSSYAVLRRPAISQDPAPAGGWDLLMATATQRNRGGHGHPDRGHINLYSPGGVPMVLDPGVGWSGCVRISYLNDYRIRKFVIPLKRTLCGRRYNWLKVHNGTANGPWYRGSESHSMVTFLEYNTTADSSSWVPQVTKFRIDCPVIGYGLFGCKLIRLMHRVAVDRMATAPPMSGGCVALLGLIRTPLQTTLRLWI